MQAYFQVQMHSPKKKKIGELQSSQILETNEEWKYAPFGSRETNEKWKYAPFDSRETKELEVRLLHKFRIQSLVLFQPISGNQMENDTKPKGKTIYWN